MKRINKKPNIMFESLSNRFRKKVLDVSLKSETKKGKYTKYPICTYYKSKDKYIAMDNRTNDCWVEEFKTKKQAKAWLNDEIDSQGNKQ